MSSLTAVWQRLTNPVKVAEERLEHGKWQCRDADSRGLAPGYQSGLRALDEAITIYRQLLTRRTRKFSLSETPSDLGIRLAAAIKQRGDAFRGLVYGYEIEQAERRSYALQALQAYDEAIAIYLRQPSCWEKLAVAFEAKGSLLTWLGLFETSLSANDEALSLFLGHLSERKYMALAWTYGRRARTLNALHRPEDALEACDKAMARYAEYRAMADAEHIYCPVGGFLSTVYEERGRALETLGQHESAREAFATSRRCVPTMNTGC